MSTVAIVKGAGRRSQTRQCLELIAGEIRRTIGSRQPVIKPNCVSTHVQLASTHVDHLRGILDVLCGIVPGKILIAESSPHDTRAAYRAFRYRDLLREYPVELIDLNDGPFETLMVNDGTGRMLRLRAARLLLDDSTYLVSAAGMKTHDTVVVSLSIKNLVMGGIHREDKKKVHQGTYAINRALASIAERVWPDLSVIDGFEGMEGEGPCRGRAVPLGIALASTDALAADRTACRIMGVDPRRVGYLCFCAEQRRGKRKRRVRIAGEPLRSCITSFRLPANVQEQYAWRGRHSAAPRRKNSP